MALILGGAIFTADEIAGMVWVVVGAVAFGAVLLAVAGGFGVRAVTRRRDINVRIKARGVAHEARTPIEPTVMRLLKEDMHADDR